MPTEARLIAAAVLLAGLLGLVAAFGAHERSVGAASVQARWDAQRLADTAAVLAETQRQSRANADAASEAQRMAAHARTAAAALADDRRLHDYSASLARACAPAAAASGSAAASTPGDMQTGLLDRVTAAARELAAYADAVRIAADTCVRVR